MKFGQDYEDAPKATGGEGGARWMKTLKEGETRMRFLDEVKKWKVYWEHYNPTPGGFPFPCTGDKTTCPGCNSGIEKMEKASRKVAMNVKVGDYVDVYKFNSKLANRMEIRSERNGGTVLDRDFLITRVGKDKDSEYDVDTFEKSTPDLSGVVKYDIEQMLADAFTEAWPDFDLGKPTTQAKPTGFHEGEPGTEPDFAKDGNTDDSRPTDRPVDRPAGSDAPAEQEAKAQEKEVTEEELRAMSYDDLVELCKNENIDAPFNSLETPNDIVDWMLEHL